MRRQRVLSQQTKPNSSQKYFLRSISPRIEGQANGCDCVVNADVFGSASSHTMVQEGKGPQLAPSYGKIVRKGLMEATKLGISKARVRNMESPPATPQPLCHPFKLLEAAKPIWGISTRWHTKASRWQ